MPATDPLAPSIKFGSLGITIFDQNLEAVPIESKDTMAVRDLGKPEGGIVQRTSRKMSWALPNEVIQGR